jgi:hypothetical protein
MKIIKITLIIIAVLALIFMLSGWYMGYFSLINIEEKEEGGYKIIGVNVTGPYSNVAKDMEQVSKQLKDMGVVSTKGFGIYYDDPKMVPAEKCRSFVGNIIEEKDFKLVSEFKPEGLKIDSILKAKSVVAEFPIKNSLSFMIGPMKVYPALSNYMRGKGYTSVLSVEIYDIPNKKIMFMMQYK